MNQVGTGDAAPGKGKGPNGIELSVLVVTYNHYGYILPCLRSIAQNSGGLGHEVIVADNHSTDGSLQLIRQYFPQTRLIENRKNLGLARAMNQAYRESRGEHLLVLNPDIQILPGSIEKMVSFLRVNREVGLVLPQLISSDGSLQYSCRTFCDPFTLLFRRAPLGWVFPRHPKVRHHLMIDWDHKDTREVDWGLGACMLIRKDALRRSRIMDERFFLYYEDIDLCFSLKRAGWKVVYYPEAVMVHHHLRQSAGGLFRRAKWEHLNSSVKFHLKYRSLRPRP